MRKKVLIVLLSLSLLLLIIWGFSISGQHWRKGLTKEGDYSFLENLLSEGIGLLAEAMIITVIVTYVIDQNEAKKWRQIRTNFADSLINGIHRVFLVADFEIYERINKTPALWNKLDSLHQRILENNHKNSSVSRNENTINISLQKIELLKTQYFLSLNFELMKFTESIKEKLIVIDRLMVFRPTNDCQMNLKNGEIANYIFKHDKGIQEDIIQKSLELRENVLNLKKEIYQFLNNDLKNIIDKEKLYYLTMLDNVNNHGDMTESILCDFDACFKNDSSYTNFKPNNFDNLFGYLRS